jgi:hypothetical protein
MNFRPGEGGGGAPYVAYEHGSVRNPFATRSGELELELELIQTQMAQKPMLRAKVYARGVRVKSEES